MSVVFFVGVFLTFGYRYRLFVSLFQIFDWKVVFVHRGWIMFFFSFVLVGLSVFGLWWMVLNVFVVPVIYLYLDLFVPVIYLLVFFFVVGVFFVFFGVELKYKFVVDLGAKHSRFMLVLLKFIDVSVGYFLKVFFDFLGVLGLVNSFFFKNFGMNVIVVLFFFLIFIL